MSYTYPPVGALFSERQCTFSVWAPLKRNIELTINGRSYKMECDNRGYWQLSLPDVPAGTRYKFRVDGNAELPDPASQYQPEGVHGASEVVDHYFPWTDSAWRGIDMKDRIIYELHVGTFTHEGTFEGVVAKLPYLSDLGVNTIELMPIGQYPGDRNWGYDGVYPFAPQQSYGGVKGLKTLVDACHQRGIAVILDVVYNHQGPEGNYYGDYAPYFTDKYKTHWGQAINFDDAYSDGVRNFYWQNAIMWLRDYHIDGLRLDAVHAIWDNGAEHFVSELAKKVRVLEEHIGRKLTLIAEFDLNNPRYIDPISRGGYGLDGQWIDEFHHALHALVTGEVNGYYEDFGDPGHLAKAFKDSYVYTGEYSKHRKKHFGAITTNHYGKFVAFAQNHDQVGNRMLGDRLASQLNFEQLKLVAATYLLSPHVPMLFMGEEYGETNPFQYFISHGDESLIESVRNGRQDEFKYFDWRANLPDPQSEETFLACKLSWKHEHDQQSATLLAFYRHLIQFRKANAAMRSVERNSIIVNPPSGKLVSYERSGEQQRLLIMLNFESIESNFMLSEGLRYRVLINSSSKTWFGPNAILQHETITGIIKLSPFSAVVAEILLS